MLSATVLSVAFRGDQAEQRKLWKRIPDLGASVSAGRKRDSGSLSLRENDGGKKNWLQTRCLGWGWVVLVTPGTTHAGKRRGGAAWKRNKTPCQGAFVLCWWWPCTPQPSGWSTFNHAVPYAEPEHTVPAAKVVAHVRRDFLWQHCSSETKDPSQAKYIN